MAFHPITQKAAPAGQSILRLRRAPSSRGYSAVARRSRAAHGMTKRENGLSYISSHPAAGANLRPFGAPPSKGRREKSQSLPLEGKCVSNRWKMRVPLSPYRHFERSEKSSLHNGQMESVRGRTAPMRFSLSLICAVHRQGVKIPRLRSG